jgi:hypothetical protein
LPQALALIAAAVSTAALLVVASLTVFLASLAVRAKRTPGSRRATRVLEMSRVGEPQANRPPPSAAETSRPATDVLDDGTA